MPRLRLPILILCLSGLLVLTGELACAQPRPPNQEYAIKSAYLGYFGTYVTWPAIQGDEFVIGILGKNPFSAAMVNGLQKKPLHGKQVIVRRFPSMADYKPCQMLFISHQADPTRPNETPKERLTAALAVTDGKPVLVVCEDQGAAKQGATINFFLDENRVKMEMNLQAEQRAQLKIGAKLRDLERHGIVKIVTEAPRQD